MEPETSTSSPVDPSSFLSPAMPFSIADSSASSSFGAYRAAVTKRNGSARATPLSSLSRMSFGETPAAVISRRLRSTAMPPSFPSSSSRSNVSFLPWRERAVDELLPVRRLFRIKRFGVAQEQHVAQLDRGVAVVLRKLVGVELRERPREPAFYSRGERLLFLLPVERHELAELVGALDHLLERLRYERAGSLAPRKFAHQEQRHMAQLHLAASFSRQCGHILGLVCANKLRDPRGDSASLFIKRIFPEQARQHRPAKLRLRTDLLCHRSLMRSRRKHSLPYIHFRHVYRSPFQRLCRNFSQHCWTGTTGQGHKALYPLSYWPPNGPGENRTHDLPLKRRSNPALHHVQLLLPFGKLDRYTRCGSGRQA